MKRFVHCKIRFVSSGLLLIGLLLTIKLPGGSGTLHAQDFRALFIADTHISNDTSKVMRLQWLVKRINSGAFPGVELMLHGGDVVASVYDEPPQKFPQKTRDRLATAVEILHQLKIPFYLAMGNHDYKIWHDRDSDAYFPREEILQMEAIWKEHTGFKPYYAVLHKGWNFIILNSMRGRYLHRHFDDPQMNFFEQELQKGYPTIIISHFPLKTDHFRIWCWPKDLITAQNEPRFFELLRKFSKQIKGIFVGHGHMWRQDILFGEIPIYEVADFAERKEIPYYLIECSLKNEMVRVVSGNLNILKYKKEATIE